MATNRRRPGPKGPNKDLIEAVVAMKRRNTGWGCPRIAEQISLAFGVEIDKDLVRRVPTKVKVFAIPQLFVGFFFSQPRM